MLKKCCKDHQFESTHCGFVAPGEDSGESDKPGDTVSSCEVGAMYNPYLMG